MSQVVIGDILPYTQATAIASQIVFGTNWTANAASDVVVYKTPAGSPPNDVTQILPYPSGYSVSFIGALQQVQVTLVVPASAGDIITITRQTPADRMNLYTNTNFVPSMLNNDFGILTLVDQQAQLVDQRIGPRYNYSAIIVDVVDTILPVLGASQFWAKDPTNTFIQAVDVSSVISGGTVTQINTGTGLTGGPITNAGTISFASIAANSLWANVTGGAAVPTVIPTAYFLQSANNLSDVGNAAAALANLGGQAANAALTSIAGLTTVANNLIYTTASNTYAVLAPANSSTLVTSAGGVPSWSQTLPQAVQTNIQYLGVQNQNLNMGGFQINNGADPTQPSDYATKNYVDLNALTGTSVYAATTTNLTVTQAGSGVGATLTNAGAQAIFALDGVSPPLSSKVLVKNLATAANEGIYTVTNVGSVSTNWVLTRSTTYDTPTEVNQTGLIIVQNGSTLAGTAWYNSVTIVTVDVTSFSYSQFGNITFPVSLAHGGTNANLTASNGAIVYSGSTALALSAVGTSGALFQSAGAGTPVWTTATYPSVATSTGSFIYANGTNFVASTSIWPNTVGTSGKIIQSNGTANIYSTPTYPLTAGTVGNVLTSDGTNWLSSVPAVPTTIAITNDTTTNATMFPVWVTANTGSLPLKVTSTKFGFNPSTGSMILTGTLQGSTGVQSSTGVNLLTYVYTASAVNYLQFQNNATGFSPSIFATGSDTNVAMNLITQGSGALNLIGYGGTTNLASFSSIASAVNYITFQNNTTLSAPAISAIGSDANITLQLNGKGTSGVDIYGVSTNTSAPTGAVGQYTESVILAASAVTCTNNTAVNVTSVSMAAGDYDTWGNIEFQTVGGTAPRQVAAWISTTSATIPDSALITGISLTAAGGVLAAGNAVAVPSRRLLLSTTTTVYISAITIATSGNGSACGYICFRRRR